MFDKVQSFVKNEQVKEFGKAVVSQVVFAIAVTAVVQIAKVGAKAIADRMMEERITISNPK